jgi:alkanesulfonate monooxygenase SsuD/methylene tetrahydromethanopterin reductase-like flavin-dependent oxidoreductase (luciferase family)
VPASRLEVLAERARPARLGVVVEDPTTVVRRVAALCSAGVAADLLLEIHAPARLRDPLVTAAGGPDRWRTNAFVPWYDPDCAGLVILAEGFSDRTAMQAALADAVARRHKHGHDHRRFSIAVRLAVSIGRTMAEAAARASRDPALSGPHHPRDVGLFGTLEQAQGQILGIARAGADAIRATLAEERDVADLLAQLRAVAVGPTPVLHSRSG